MAYKYLFERMHKDQIKEETLKDFETVSIDMVFVKEMCFLVLIGKSEE